MTRVFFSYSHDDDDHKTWVRNRADDLMSRGFEVLLDQADLKFGWDIDHFVESAIESADFVLLICTPAYGAKANGRTHGVGTETVIIKSELNEGATDKFVAVLKLGPPQLAIPKYMKTRLFVDLTADNASKKWEELCSHMRNGGKADQIGTLVFEALFPFDKDRIYGKPRLRDLKRFTQFCESGQTEEGRWYVVRRDPIKNDYATILFQDPVETTS